MPKLVPSDCLNFLCLQIAVYHLNPDMPELDLILLGKADYFVGNCVSSFSAFVKRERDSNGKPSEFFGLEQLKSDLLKDRKTELWFVDSLTVKVCYDHDTIVLS